MKIVNAVNEMPKGRLVATLTAKGIGKMSKAERRDLAKWLKKTAQRIESDGALYSDGRFTAKFNYC